MTTSTANTLVTNAITNLEGLITQSFNSLYVTVLVVTVLFAGIFILKSLWHRRV